MILWGPPGTGKTTIARLIAGATDKAFEPMSAVNAGVKDVREVVERARNRLGERGQGTILFLDEVHRFNKTQQDALLPHVEDGLLVLVGATTENPYFSLTSALLSRSTLFRLEPLEPEDLRSLMERALADPTRGLGGDGLTIEEDALEHIADRSEGDARHALTSLEVAAALTAEAGRPSITLEFAEAALAMRALRYGDDEHYDVVSAFIKSIRGSDPDSGLYWLARMLEAGEDARFIARRLVILASEDVGMADPLALPLADGRGPCRRVRRAARGPAEPRPRGRVSGERTEVEQLHRGARRGDGGRARPPHRSGSGASAGFALSGGGAPWARSGLRLSSRHPRGLGAPGVPPGGDRRAGVLPADRSGGGRRSPTGGRDGGTDGTRAGRRWR